MPQQPNPRAATAAAAAAATSDAAAAAAAGDGRWRYGRYAAAAAARVWSDADAASAADGWWIWSADGRRLPTTARHAAAAAAVWHAAARRWLLWRSRRGPRTERRHSRHSSSRPTRSRRSRRRRRPTRSRRWVGSRERSEICVLGAGLGGGRGRFESCVDFETRIHTLDTPLHLHTTPLAPFLVSLVSSLSTPTAC